MQSNIKTKNTETVGKKTLTACFIGYIVQAVVNNFVPLLFVTFQNTYKIPLTRITLLITVNFIVQLIVDLLSAVFINKIGYRPCVVFAHICSAVGLIMLTVLPELLPNAFLGILISVCVYAVGGGLIEVIISPMVEACPTKNKEKTMSLLHSFYCWGHVAVVLISTVFFALFGINNWKILALIWSLIPICNAIIFFKVPIFALESDEEKGLNLKQLFGSGVFWLLLIMMICSGSAEQSVSQWASAFAEKGLNIGKTLGDIAGPMAFAAFMGISRLIFGKFGDKLNLTEFMYFSCALCIVCYLLISLVPSAFINLLAAAVCGFSVGILWPGTYSIASASLKNGGTAMFALLALAGDVGCTVGPTLTGMVSSAFNNNLRWGILAAVVFPVMLILSFFILRKVLKKNEKQ